MLRFDSKKRSLTKVFIFVSIFCFVSIGACYSWFVDTKNGNGSITFGKVELEIGGVTGTNPFSISISSRKQPNDQLLSSNITVKKSSTSADCYLRVNVEFDSTYENMAGYVSAFNTMLSTAFFTTGYKYVLYDGWYYLTTTAETPVPISITSTNTYNLFNLNNFVMPYQLDQLSNYLQYDESVVLSIVFDAVQSINTNAVSVSDVKNLFVGEEPLGAPAQQQSTPLTSFNVSDNVIVGFVGQETEVYVPETITSISDFAFYNTNVEYIFVPNTVASIGQYSFYECINLVSVEFESTSILTHIYESAFSSCTALESITIPLSCTHGGANIFDGCSSLLFINFENSDIPVDFDYDWCGYNSALITYNA